MGVYMGLDNVSNFKINTEMVDDSLKRLKDVSTKEMKFLGRDVKQIVNDLNKLIRFFVTLFSSGSPVWKGDSALAAEELKKRLGNLQSSLNTERKNMLDKEMAMQKTENYEDDLGLRMEDKEIEEMVTDKVDEMLKILFELNKTMSKKEKKEIAKPLRKELEALENNCIKIIEEDDKVIDQMERDIFEAAREHFEEGQFQENLKKDKKHFEGLVKEQEARKAQQDKGKI